MQLEACLGPSASVQCWPLGTSSTGGDTKRGPPVPPWTALVSALALGVLQDAQISALQAQGQSGHQLFRTGFPEGLESVAQA